MSTNPSLSGGAGFWRLSFKPLDNYTYFHGESNLLGAPVGLKMCGRNYKFSPKQVTLSLIPNGLGSDRELSVRVSGVDQFGFLASEIITLRTDKDTASRQGTRKCYSGYYDIVLVSASGTQSTDKYAIGYGRSIDDAASPPPRPDNSIRVPLPVRVRSSSAVHGVHLSLAGKSYPAGDFSVDVAAQSVEVVLDQTDDEVHAVVVLNPAYALA